MKLSELAFNCIKTATGYGDPSFTYLSFITKEGFDNPDYAPTIERVFSNINSFFSRLSSIGKIPTEINEVKPERIDASTHSINVSVLRSKPRKIVCVFQMLGNNDYENLRFARIGKEIKIIDSKYDASKPVCVQYRPIVKSFSQADIPFVTTLFGEYGESKGYSLNGIVYENEEDMLEAVAENDIDLYEEYMIPEDAMPLCEHWCKAFNDEMAYSISHSLMVETESRMLDLEVDDTIFVQNKIREG